MLGESRSGTMKKKIGLLCTEPCTRLGYIQEIGKPYPDSLGKKIVKKIMSFTKIGRR